MDEAIESIQDRTFNFACRVVRLYRFLIKEDRSNETFCRQLVRSGTSIGANLEEACAAQSRADFIAKCHIALKEARESYYWLRLCHKTGIVPESRLHDLIKECNEIISILTVILKKSKSSKV